MKLRDYIWAMGMSHEEFAKKIRYSTVYLGNVMAGTLNPGPKFIEDVEKATHGLVQPHEISCKKGWMLPKKEEIQEEIEQFTFAEIAN